MSYFSVILPAAKTNLITNPSFETNTTGWTANGAGVSIARVATYQRRGAYSCEVTTATGVVSAAFCSITLTSGTQYTFSADVRDVSGQAFQIYFLTGGIIKGTTTWTGTGAWARRSVTFTADATAVHELVVRRDAVSATDKFYIDGCQLETGAQTTYFDGDSLDCKWTGTKHGSTSSRPASSRAGGTVTDLQDLGFYTSEVQGLGMAGIELYIQDIGALPGALFTGSKVTERDFSLIGEIVGSSFTDLHSKRKALIDALKNDRVKDKQAVTLVYSGSNSGKPLRIKARYTGGLAAGGQIGFSEKTALKFIATDPYWYEDGDEGAALTATQTIVDADYAAKRVDGVWSNISTNFNNNVYAIVKLPNGNYVLGGNFTDVGDLNGDYIVQYNPTTGAISSMGTGMNNTVLALAVAPNGDVYAGGNFTLAGGVANTARIAKWNGTAWVALSTGIGNGGVQALAFDNSGNLYVGGTFIDHVDANGDYITKWNGTAFSSLGTGMNDFVLALATAPNGDIYVGGKFTTGNGVTLNGIGKWTGTTFAALGTGVTTTTVVYTIEFDDAGNIYAGGEFTVAGGVAANYIAKWDGSTWSALGSGTNNAVRIIVYSNGLLYVGGFFTAAGGLSLADRVAIWNGTTWAHLPIDLPGTPTVYAIVFDGDDLYVGYDTSGAAYSSYLNAVTNSGTAAVYPKVIFTNTGQNTTLAYLKNETTGATIWLNYVIQNGESVTLDFSLANREVMSNYRGNVIGTALLRNSDFADFYLLPGENKISAHTFYSPAPGNSPVTATITYPLTHWSHDGSAV